MYVRAYVWLPPFPRRTWLSSLIHLSKQPIQNSLRTLNLLSPMVRKDTRRVWVRDSSVWKSVFSVNMGTWVQTPSTYIKSWVSPPMTVTTELWREEIGRGWGCWPPAWLQAEERLCLCLTGGRAGYPTLLLVTIHALLPSMCMYATIK